MHTATLSSSFYTDSFIYRLPAWRRNRSGLWKTHMTHTHWAYWEVYIFIFWQPTDLPVCAFSKFRGFQEDLKAMLCLMSPAIGSFSLLPAALFLHCHVSLQICSLGRLLPSATSGACFLILSAEVNMPFSTPLFYRARNQGQKVPWPPAFCLRRISCPSISGLLPSHFAHALSDYYGKGQGAPFHLSSAWQCIWRRANRHSSLLMYCSPVRQ